MCPRIRIQKLLGAEVLGESDHDGGVKISDVEPEETTERG
jgi:hypothetical protein